MEGREGWQRPAKSMHVCAWGVHSSFIWASLFLSEVCSEDQSKTALCQPPDNRVRKNQVLFPSRRFKHLDLVSTDLTPKPQHLKADGLRIPTPQLLRSDRPGLSRCCQRSSQQTLPGETS